MPPVRSRVVVEHRDRDQALARSAQHLPDERRTGLAGAKDDDSKAHLIVLATLQREQP
jgi:hypothetical protein